MKGRWKKFLSYYTNYKVLFFKDMFCAMVSAAITLVYPMLTRYITGTILNQPKIDYSKIYLLGIFMLCLIVVEYFCNYFIGYLGHVMGVYMERDLRNELFSHYQKLSFRFYDEQNTGQLMSRLTNDLFSLTELYHHGPEDIVISIIKFIGAFILLSYINVKLTLILFAILPFMFLFAWYYNKKMKTAIKKIMTDFYRRKQEKEIGWLTGVTCRMFCRWEDLREAVKEAKDLTQGGEEYLACSAKVISAIEFIRNNYARQICLEDIAEYAGVSRVYLSQIFKKETGKNISDYLVEYRLGKAKELLLNSNLKIYTIAELCGFGSAQYFNKIFKKMNGISPYQLKDNKLQ